MVINRKERRERKERENSMVADGIRMIEQVRGEGD
jgi:hypothetical protein